MIRLAATIVIAAALLPASAEAAKMRFGGSRSSHATANTPARGGNSFVVVPRMGGSSNPVDAKASANTPAHVPFPPSSVEPTLLKVTAAEPPKSWCRSEVVVGGFCVIN